MSGPAEFLVLQRAVGNRSASRIAGGRALRRRVLARELAVSPNAYNNVGIYPVVEDVLPKTTGAPFGETKTAPDGSYVLHPNVDDAQKVVYYVAYSKKRQRSEIVVGPGKVADFFRMCIEPRIAGFNMWEIAAANYFGMTGGNTEWQRLSAQATYFAMQGDFAGYWRAWKGAQIAAFKDPGWWAYAAGGLSGGGAAGDLDAAAAQARADAEAAAAGKPAAPSAGQAPKPAEPVPAEPGPASGTQGAAVAADAEVALAKSLTEAEFKAEIERLRDTLNKLPQKDRGPVVSGCWDTVTDEVTYGVNQGKVPTKIHPLLKARYEAYLNDTGGVTPPKAGIPGAHSEVGALNKALWAADPTGAWTSIPEGRFTMYNQQLYRNQAPSVPPKCDNCMGIIPKEIKFLH